MKTISLTVLTLVVLVALSPGASSVLQLWSVPPIIASGDGTIQTLSAAANWTAIGLTPLSDHTLSAVKVMVGGVTGTLAAGNLSLEVYSDTGAGKPYAALGGSCSTITVTAVPTGPLFTEFTGLSCALTRATQYWMVIKNMNGTPASNNFSIRAGASSTGGPNNLNDTQTMGNNMYAVSTTSGSAWTLSPSKVPMFRVAYSDDSSYFGFPVTHIANPDSTNPVYGTREVGSAFTSPPVIVNVRGVAMSVKSNGTPTANMRFNVWVGNSGTLTSCGYTNSIAPSYSASAQSTINGYFSTPCAIPANSTIRVVLGEDTNSDASTKNYQIIQLTIDNDANSRATMPFQGSLKMTLCTSNCGTASNWTDTNTAYYPFLLLTETAGEFSAPSAPASAPRSYPIIGQLHQPGVPRLFR